MYQNREIEQHHVVTNSPGERRETVTERTETGPQEFSISPGMIVTIALLSLLAIGITVYIVNNKNANEAANREAMLEAANQTNKEQPAPAPAIVPPTQPVIIQQPAPQAPVIVQQPAQAGASSVLDDVTIQEVVTKRLIEDPSLTAITATVVGGQAILTGTVDTADIKARAERVAKGVRGVKSVENKIVVSNH